MTKKQLLNKIHQWQKLRAEIATTINEKFYKQFCDGDCFNCKLGVCDEYTDFTYCLFFDASAEVIEENLKKLLIQKLNNKEN